jgi:hypothetical protein
MSFAKRRRPGVARLTTSLAVVTMLLCAPGAAIASTSTTGAAPTETTTTTGTPRAVTRPPVAKPESGRRVVTRPTGAEAAAAPKAAEAAAAAVTGSTSFAYTSEAGDWVGQGQSETFTASADMTVSISGTANHLSVNVHDATYSSWWSVTLSAGTGDTLRPGSYLKAERDPFRTGRSPGLDASGDGRGCNEVYGSFTVNQIGFDATGAVDLADVSFVRRCESATAPAFKGTIHLNQLPLSYRQVSDAGDYIGGGVTKTYLNSTSIVTVQGTASAVSVNVSGLRDWWYGSISAPTGSNFAVGKVYQTARFSDSTHAGLDVFGDGRGCNSSTGTLTIKKLQLSADGSVTNLSAVFEQHCEGGTPALHGTLHYFA